MTHLFCGIFLFILIQGQSIAQSVDQTRVDQTEYLKEDVTFRNGPISLAGRLYLPRVGGRAPSVIFTHGSGDAGRDNPRYVTEADFLAKNGIAVLLFDKRGVGNSTGDWKKANFQDLAADAVAAFKYLESRPEVDPNKIGFRGASQSGYVLPIAASMEPRVAFIVLLSPPMVTPYKQILFNVEAELRDANFSDQQVNQALLYTRAGLDYARRGKRWDVYQQLGNEAKKQPWFEIAAGPESKDDPMLSWFHMILDFDPIPYLKKVRCPVLVFFAGKDKESPVPAARPMLEHALSDHGRHAYRIVFYPDANHDLRVGRTLANGYLETFKGWVLEQTAAADKP